MIQFRTLLLLLLTVSAFSLSLRGWSQQPSVHILEVFTAAANPEHSDKRILISDKYVNMEILTYWDVNDFLLSNLDSFGLELDDSGRVILPNAIYLQNCRFSDELNLTGLKITGLTIDNSDVYRVTIRNSDISRLVIRKSRLDNITLNGSHFVDIQIDNNQLIDVQIHATSLSGGGNLGDNRVMEIQIQNSRFDLKNWFSIYTLEDNIEPIDLVMRSSVFDGSGPGAVKLNADFHNLFIREDTFNVKLFFGSSKVSERLIMANNHFTQQVYFDYLLFSETRNELYWSQFEGGKIGYAELSEPFNVDSLIAKKDDVRFKNLISTYKTLHNIFSLRGDLQSANDCYNEMKELEGRWLEQQHLENPSFASYFRWKLNRLLKHYTNHGTDPALAVVISCYVILAFAVLYMFFPSEWDDEDGKKFLKGIKNIRNTEKGRFHFVPVLLDGTIIVVNAITLSLNSFVTLGFGRIPTRGLARYLCIIEGFLGWFLLSIFTVALINQVLA